MDYQTIRGACLVLAIVSLTPLALYLAGRIKEPFHPLTLVGVLAFGLADFKLLMDPGPALNYVTAGALVEFELIAAFSLLCLYAGWYWRSQHHSGARWPGAPLGPVPDPCSASRLLACGWLMAILALAGWMVAIHNVQSTGYATDWQHLETPGAVLLIQALLLDRNLLWPALAGLGIDLAGSARHFYTYGSRHTAAVMLTALAVPFFFKGTRPRKHLVVSLGLIAGLVMMTLAATRSVVGSGEASNRFSAIWVAGGKFLHGGTRHYNAGREFVVGAAEVQVVQETQSWNYGRVFPDIAIVFLPHAWFPHKYAWVSQWDAPHFVSFLKYQLGLNYKHIAYGCAPTGFADAYVNFWWLFPLFWLLLGYYLHYIYTGATRGQRLDYQAYLLCWFMVLFLAVGQDLEAGGFQALFTLPPTWLAYRYAQEHHDWPGRPMAAITRAGAQN